MSPGCADDSQRPGQKGQNSRRRIVTGGEIEQNFFYVMAGLLIGVALGIASYYSFPDKATAVEVAKYMSLVSTIFLRLIKMIIGPLVLSTLIVGIGHMEMRRRSGGSAPRRWAGL